MNNPVDLQQILAARERRVLRQQQFLRQYSCPLVSFTMNIAGPVKNSPLISEAFRMGCQLLERQFAAAGAIVKGKELCSETTGCEALYAVELEAGRLKALTVDLEEGTPAGRLFDMDVIGTDGRKLDRPAPRTCLICGKPGAQCARSRAHSVEQLQAETTRLLTEALLAYDSEFAAQTACRALLYEVAVTPKPGLVDRSNSGSHTDMDIYTFFDSTAALYPYFAACFRIGRTTAHLPPRDTLKTLRLPGRLAESAMLEATKGVNTHKGAIFTLGILCAALGRLPREFRPEPSRLAEECASMTQGLVEEELSGLTEDSAATAGQLLFVRYGITGVRGQLEAGLPTVFSHGLPALEQALSHRRSNDEAGCAALLALMSVTPDTNLITRGGKEAADSAARQAADLLKQGLTMEAAEELDAAFRQKNLSPGGCADLLSVCWFLHFLKQK